MRRLTLLWLFAARLAGAAPNAGPASVTDFALKADDYLKSALAAGRFAGSVMVAQSNQIVFMRGYGLANRELNVTNAPDTKFKLGSVTKQFTALCILILQEQGKLNIDDPISKYLPDCPAAWSQIKIRHLLTHTAGIPDYTGLPEYRSSMMLPWPPEKMMKCLRDKPLEFEPGTRFAYSNSGYFLLSSIIEKAAGQGYEPFLKQFIFDPLRMTNSGCDHFETILPHRAAGYSRDGDAWVNSAYTDTAYPQGDGALYSTVEDFFLWYQCLREHRLVSQSSWNAMTTPVRENYGFGIAVVEPFGQKELAHDGRVNGFVASMRWLPGADVFVAAFANFDSAHAGEVADSLTALLLNQPLKLPPPQESIKLETGQIKAFAGRYQSVEQTEIVCNVTAGDGHLVLQTAAGPKLVLLPESETNFFCDEMPDLKVTFWRDASGKVSRLVSHLNGADHEAKRLAGPP
jgi:CubicO group peptidase (beta-lactamase class C family)